MMRGRLRGASFVGGKAREGSVEFDDLTAQRGDARLNRAGGTAELGGDAGQRGQRAFQSSGFLTQARDHGVLLGRLRVQLGKLRGGAFIFGGNLLAAHEQFFATLAIEGDSVLGAIQFELGLADPVLVLPHFRIQFIDAAVNLLLLGFECPK